MRTAFLFLAQEVAMVRVRYCKNMSHTEFDIAKNNDNSNAVRIENMDFLLKKH